MLVNDPNSVGALQPACLAMRDMSRKLRVALLPKNLQKRKSPAMRGFLFT